MADIIFNPDERDYQRAERPEIRSGLVKLVMSLGVRSESAASKVLLFVALVIFIISAIILFRNL